MNSAAQAAPSLARDPHGSRVLQTLIEQLSRQKECQKRLIWVIAEVRYPYLLGELWSQYGSSRALEPRNPDPRAPHSQGGDSLTYLWGGSGSSEMGRVKEVVESLHDFLIGS